MKITFKSNKGIHTVTVDGQAHTFIESEDAIEGKSALSMAWDLIAIIGMIKDKTPRAKLVKGGIPA